MYLIRLFLSFRGRISRSWFLAGNVLGMMASSAFVLVFLSLTEIPPPAVVESALTTIEEAVSRKRLRPDVRQALLAQWTALLLVPGGFVSAWGSLALTVKRAHDRGWSTLITLGILVIPFVNIVWSVLELLLGEGAREVNRHGPPPPEFPNVR